jgi:hypothetical protein
MNWKVVDRHAVFATTSVEYSRQRLYAGTILVGNINIGRKAKIANLKIRDFKCPISYFCL